MAINGILKYCIFGTVMLALQAPLALRAQPLEGDFTSEYRYFLNAENANPSASGYRGDATFDLHLKYDKEYLNDSSHFILDTHATGDEHDNHRSRFDFNELAWRYAPSNFSLLAGMHTEFWGVTESWHLVDILNQTDLTQNIDQHAKLGQMMVKASSQTQLGNFNLYVLPFFRDRVFVGERGRLKPVFNVDEKLATYESSQGDHHVDYAARYSNTIGMWDFGVAQFIGTGREPLLRPVMSQNKPLVLAPYYEQIKQTSVDAQMTADGLLLKLEAISHSSQDQNYRSVVAGLEYTQVGVFGSRSDLGYLVENLYDERGEQATMPFSNDLFLALRYVANNIAQTTYLMGVYAHRGTGAKSYRFEMTTRLEDGLALSLEGQAFAQETSRDLFYSYRDDSYMTVKLKKSF